MEARSSGWCAMLLCLGLAIGGLARAAGAVAEDAMLNQCSELKAQEHVDLNEVMGKWYVVEVIGHRSEVAGQGVATTSTGEMYAQRVLIDACPTVELRSLAETRVKGPPRISMVWRENAGDLEYTFWVSSNRGPGVWNADIAQNGTLADKPSFKQFTGTVHVMKAVAPHMVLTFCARSADGQKFSVLLGREHRLPKTDVRGVHRLLERRYLQLYNIRESCANAASALGQSDTPVLAILATFLWTMLQKLVAEASC